LSGNSTLSLTGRDQFESSKGRERLSEFLDAGSGVSERGGASGDFEDLLLVQVKEGHQVGGANRMGG